MAGQRYETISGAVRTAIESGRLKPGDALPSEQELARTWGVCRMTAHRAMQELQRQGLVTRRPRAGTIVAAPAAPSMPGPAPEATGTATRTVGLLFFNTCDFPQVSYIHGIRAGLPDSWHLSFCDTRNDPEREAEQLERMGREADGIICYPTCAPENTPLLRRLQEQGIPLVCVDRCPDELTVDAVVTDNYGSSREALRYLARERGHRRIAHFNADCLNLSSVRERHTAYHAVMAELGEAEAAARWERLLLPGLGNDFDHLVRAIHDALFTMLHQPDPPTAVFCLDDYYMLAVLEACDKMGVAVPDTLDVLSFSDCPPALMRAAQGRVHRLTQATSEMGRRAAELLLKQTDPGSRVEPTIHRLPAHFYPAPALKK